MAIKRVHSPIYNSMLDTETGFFARWGRTVDEDPIMCPVGPEIADIEISTICYGPHGVPCTFCYKSNTETGENMSIETFKMIMDKMPRSLGQAAYGIGSIESNPDIWKILSYSREKGVIPNITVNGEDIAGEVAQKLANVCGAVAVSHYGDDLCFNAVQALYDAGLHQINIHKLLAQETLKSCFSLIDSVASDPRLAGLKAVVFLLLKPKGLRNELTPIKDLEDYRKLFAYAADKGVAIGMDTCSAPHALKTMPYSARPSIEGCEAGIFSIYINVRGEVTPCSFSPGVQGWETGLPMSEVKDFTEDIWYHPKIRAWRSGLLKSSTSSGCNSCSGQSQCRSCQIYDISICQPKPYLQKSTDLVQIKSKRPYELCS